MRHNWTFVITAAAVLVAAPLAAQKTQNVATAPAAPVATTQATRVSTAPTTPLATAPATPLVTAPAPTTPAPTATAANPAEARFAPYAATKDGAVDRVNGEHAVATGPMAASAMRQPTRHNKALMIVGAAGLLLGAVIGGDAGTIIMIGSGAVGLYGLYQYLQ